MIIAIVSIVLASAVISWRLAKGINFMQENHPDYKGEDLFDEDFELRLYNEPKQETLEDAYNRIYNSIDFTEFCFSSFKIGAKWQAEKMYSEEEVLKILQKFEDSTEWDINKFFEQFKKNKL